MSGGNKMVRAGWAALLLVVTVVAIPTSGVSAAVTGPASCVATTAGGSIAVTWPAAAEAAEYVIYRTVNNSPSYWRGKTSELTFTDSLRSGTIVYSVVSKAADGAVSSPTECSSEGGVEPPTAVADCTATVTGAVIDVSWPAAAGAVDYVIRRSVDGSPRYWRGKTSDLSFSDSNRSGTITYYVTSKNAVGDASAQVQCGNDGNPPPVLNPVASCTAVLGASATITWPAADGAVEYIVFRTVNGGTNYWRGRTSELTFADSTRPGTLVYSVVSKAADGRKSAATTCVPPDLEDPEGVRYLAVGDMATCNNDGADDVGNLLDTIPGPIIGLGDFAYPDGTIEEFENCFGPKLGRHKARFKPIPGNHEYYTPGAAGYYEYFGAAAGDPTKGYYDEVDGNWHIIYLNSECFEVGGCNAQSPQYQWLDATLAASTSPCLAVAMHHPRWSSWGNYNDQLFLQPMLTLMYGAGTDILLTGHAHHYERLAKVDLNQQLDATNGFRQFTIGTGGVQPRTPGAGDILAVSESLITGSYGVLDLDLMDAGYDWKFVDTNGVVRDAGADSCND